MRLAELVRRRDDYPKYVVGQLRDFVVVPDALDAWVAVDGSDIVGHVALHPRSSGPVMELAARTTGRSPEGLAVVARLMVASSARRRGVGRTLLDTACSAAAARGRLPVLDVLEEHRAAIALYRRCGWTRLGRVVVVLSDGTTFEEDVYAGPTHRSPSP